MKFEDLVCFEVNNWTPGEDYPLCEPFISWMGDDLNLRFGDEEWDKENKLCVKGSAVDMSVSFQVTATKEWVEQNCPCLLQPEYAGFVYTYPDPYFADWYLNRKPLSDRMANWQEKLRKRFEENKAKILKGIQPSDLTGMPSDKAFLNYTEENIGLTWVDDDDNVIEDNENVETDN